jgi:L-seryl-tRNA(Ser) seleniumtransferase
LGNITPTLEISWDSQAMKMKGKDIQEKLRNGSPSIEVGGVHENKISMTVWVMKPGQEKIVVKRLKEELSAAAV